MLHAVARTLFLALVTGLGNSHAAEGVVVIGNANLQPLDSETVAKIFTGKQIQVGSVYVTAVNADAGTTIRDAFLRTYLKQDESRYTGYWRVRRSIGQGKPPRELANAIDVINFVKSTPGAIGYINEADVLPGINVLLR